MTWENDSQFPQGVDRSTGLTIQKSGYERDNRRFHIRNIEDGGVNFSFDASPKNNSLLEFDENTSIFNKEYDESFVWEVERRELSDDQVEIIRCALQAYSNRIDGYARFVGNVGKRALITVCLIEKIERH